MQTFKKLAVGLAAASIVGAFGMAGSASAEVVCNQWHECWHVHDHFNDYPPAAGVMFHPDNWHGRHNHWRHDNFGHGYYRNGAWISF